MTIIKANGFKSKKPTRWQYMHNHLQKYHSNESPRIESEQNIERKQRNHQKPHLKHAKRRKSPTPAANAVCMYE